MRSQLLYPSARSSLDDAQLLDILEQVHLPQLAERVGGLDAVQDWEKLLSVGEQQRLAFARVLVHQPGIVILDEATSALDSGNEASLYARLRANGTTLISIAHRAAVLRHHTHVLHLMGEGAWAVHEASTYDFDGPVVGQAQAQVQALVQRKPDSGSASESDSASTMQSRPASFA